MDRRRAGVDAGRRTGVLPHLALALCLILTACSSGSATRFVSPDTVALAGVRMDRLRETPIYRKLERENRLPRFGEFSSRDIHEVLLTSDGKNVLAIARGADLNGTVYKGFTLYGNSAALRAAIDQSKSGGRGPRDLLARAEALPADAQIWAVVEGWRGATPDQLRALGNLANLDRVLRLVEGASLTVDLRTGAHAVFAGDARTEADAKSLADSLRGLASLARMGVQRKPDLLRALDGIQVKQDGRVVQVNFDIAEDLAEKLVR
jgi:hypothetical protein